MLAGSGGDPMRTVARSGIKTQSNLVDIGGLSGESILGPGQAPIANSLPVVIASNQTAVPVSDGGGSLTVDGTVGISGSVVLTGTFYQATLPVSGTLAATQSGTWNLAAVTTLGTITSVVHVDDNSGSLTVDAPVGTPVFVRLSD